MAEPTSETPTSETPASETPASETPASATPASETPASETPASETPAGPTLDDLAGLQSVLSDKLDTVIELLGAKVAKETDADTKTDEEVDEALADEFDDIL